MWQSILDRAIDFGTHRIRDSSVIAELTVPAFEAASQVPPCQVCEATYSQFLIRCFGVDANTITDRQHSPDTVPETLFAIGRGILLGANISYGSYKAHVLKEACIALHDHDAVRTADGLLALTAMYSKAGVELSSVERRFVNQALGSLGFLLGLFPSNGTEEIYRSAMELWHTHDPVDK